MKLDSRLSGYFGTVTHPTLKLERVYCANCGAPKGWVTQECYNFIQASSIIAICDSCEEKMGSMPCMRADIDEVPYWETQK